ncbi:hypothetical protein Snoj_32550 [Streptomyces nojiriensis]|uniref:Secreted protein n=1 Tax=Streptomyces nojiriensis TaxID=66374 RepID=A0ABQ3SMP9_9ACTN|nr:hypothetical protein JYK04_00667 [Streptomyces nojiriensis]GGS33325.1 hypothetical protein GCM10010205_74460 [Streptomyces nojiriensis]GHI69337.1 hypothetical protein Snoj_32550 [Streptomyces nojiriensis]
MSNRHAATQPRLHQDWVGSLLTAVWVVGHVAVGAPLANTGTSHVHAAPEPKRPTASRPDIDPHADGGTRACRCADRTTI